MKLFLLMMTLFVSLSSHAENHETFTKLMHKHLHSIKTSNEVELKKTVSPSYFKLMSKDNGLEELFKLQKNDGKKIVFDLKFKKFGKTGEFLVNIKDKRSFSFNHYWYVVKRVDGQYVIDREFHMD
jgi:hypothetical protein